ncbi:MAG: endo-1,4-beta-glucanase [Polyangiaceae bacterium]|jgi:hypothetical protein
MRGHLVLMGAMGLAAAACGGGASTDRSGGDGATGTTSAGSSGAGASSSGASSSGGSTGSSDDGPVGQLGEDASPVDGASATPVDGATGTGGHMDGGACTDTCPATAGITSGCEKRFLYGVNYAWKNWVADFGGVSAWGETGVSQNESAITTDLQTMHGKGVDVIRWWMLQQLEGDAVQFDSNGNVTGTGGTLIADIQAALSLAAQVGVHYNFTLFSFDDFAPSGTSSGATLHGMNPIVTSQSQLAALMNVVKTVAQTVESSPNKDRVVSWDVINEPEWAISDSDSYGDPAFSPNSSYQAVTFAQMQTFIAAVVTTLHANSSAPVSVGGAAIKWAQAWSQVDLDYYTFHMYDWVNQYYPYDNSLASYGVTGKPTVMGEFPLAGLVAVNGNPAVPLSTMLTTLFTLGYAGAMPWAFNDTCCGSFSTAGPDMQAFASAHPCVTQF